MWYTDGPSDLLSRPNLSSVSAVMKVLEIHNSDRVNFRRCRRKWDFQSGVRRNLVPVAESRAPLWFGSGIHFSLEDFYGYNRFGDPRRAFDAYVDATSSNLPDGYEEHIDVADGILSYYVDIWLPKHGVMETLWVDGKPQVEVDVEIPIHQYLPNWLMDALYEKYDDPEGVEVVVKQTFDRVTIDEHGRIHGVDYKTAKQMADPGTLQMNPQARQYYWAMCEFYGAWDAEEIVWEQFLKKVPTPPEPLKTGGLSMNKNQATTYSMYRAALIDMFGKIPKGYKDILDHLAAQEDETGDKFIRRTPLRFNEHMRRAELDKLIAEATEMLDPNIPIYPNPTRDCIWDCPFRDVSQMMDSGDDWEYMLESEYVAFGGYDDSWRTRIAWPAEATA